jgi:hypothetical protein
MVNAAGPAGGFPPHLWGSRRNLSFGLRGAKQPETTAERVPPMKSRLDRLMEIRLGFGRII